MCFCNDDDDDDDDEMILPLLLRQHLLFLHEVLKVSTGEHGGHDITEALYNY